MNGAGKIIFIFVVGIAVCFGGDFTPEKPSRPAFLDTLGQGDREAWGRITWTGVGQGTKRRGPMTASGGQRFASIGMNIPTREGDREAWDFAIAFYQVWIDSLRHKGKPQKFDPNQFRWGGFPGGTKGYGRSMTASSGPISGLGRGIIPNMGIPTRDSVTNQVVYTESSGEVYRKRVNDNQPFQWTANVKLDDGTATVHFNSSAAGNRFVTVPSDTSQLVILATPRGDTGGAISVILLGDTALRINSTSVNDNRWIGIQAIGR